MNEFTPGPQEEQDFGGLSDEVRARLLVSITQEDAEFIRRVVRQRDEAQAELGRRKAAMSELYEALTLALDWVEGFVPATEALKPEVTARFRAALAKARGEA